MISHIPADIFFISGCELMLLLDTGGRKVNNQLRQSGLLSSARVERKKNPPQNLQFGTVDDIHLMLSAASSPCTPGTVAMCGCVLAFPSPTPFLRGRLSWDGDGQKKGRREPIKEVLVLPLITKGAGISRMIGLHCSPPRHSDCVTSSGCRQPQR